MDIVYILGPGEWNEQLRYSLRSLVNVPHGDVWVVGHKPHWLHDVHHIQVPQDGPKHANTWNNWRALAEHGPAEFALFNDDFFVTQPVDGFEATHRGSLTDNIDRLNTPTLVNWHARAVATRDTLVRAGREPAFWYELHTPLPMRRDLLADAIAGLDAVRDRDPLAYCKRTWYGNFARIGGTERLDCKAHSRHAPGIGTGLYVPYLSTAPHAWSGIAGHHVRQLFGHPSHHEIGARHAAAV